jgi:hypothetical protein
MTKPNKQKPSTAYYEPYNGGYRIIVDREERGWAPTMESAADWMRRRNLRPVNRKAN